jgi:hypothetical protein
MPASRAHYGPRGHPHSPRTAAHPHPHPHHHRHHPHHCRHSLGLPAAASASSSDGALPPTAEPPPDRAKRQGRPATGKGRAKARANVGRGIYLLLGRDGASLQGRPRFRVIEAAPVVGGRLVTSSVVPICATAASPPPSSSPPPHPPVEEEMAPKAPASGEDDVFKGVKHREEES